jgi:hypothetical protein
MVLLDPKPGQPHGQPPSPKLTHLARLICFILGVALILDYMVSHYGSTAELVAGLVLVGILPLNVFPRLK